MSSTPPETAAPAAETSSQPSRGRLTDYDRLVDDLAYNDVVRAADVIVSMGSGDACPIIPASATSTRRSPTPTTSPSIRSIDKVRDIRDDLRARIIELLCDLNIRQQGAAHGRQTVRSIRLCP
jgi:hypothetical protein